jgi:cytochrome bd ubiquinol oxidase subunit II
MGGWLEWPCLLVFPGCGAFAGIGSAASVLGHRNTALFTTVVIIFAVAFGTLAISFWPYMVPFSIMIEEAAAQHLSPFMFWGEDLFVFPLMLGYAAIS